MGGRHRGYRGCIDQAVAMSSLMNNDVYKAFIKAGVPEEMAEAAAKSVGDANQLATKADLETAIAKLENRLIKWVVGLAIGIVISQTALTVTLIKLLP